MTNFEFFIKVFFAYLVVVAPFNMMLIFSALTRNMRAEKQLSIAMKSNLIAFSILAVFVLLGADILRGAGISISALKISGGLLLLVVSHKMIFDSDHGNSDYGEEEKKEAQKSEDVSVFPLATPLLAGAGAISLSILFSAEAGADIVKNTLVIFSLGTVMFVSFLSFVMATKVQKLFGATLVNIITRVMGILLAALGIQFILDGLKNSGLF